MARFVLGLLLGALLAFMAVMAAVVTHGRDLASLAKFDLPRVDLRRLDPRRIDLPRFDISPVVRSTQDAIRGALPPPEPTEINVVLDRDGARLFAGPDHARLGLSSVLVSREIATLRVPAYQGSARRWNEFKHCLRRRFEGFAVNIVEQAPTTGDHMIVHVGGAPAMLGLKPTIRGIAPHSGRVIPNAPMFVFDAGHPGAAELCQVAAHEIGHAIGLDHTRRCSDLMSYGNCANKNFGDRDAVCGEYEDRVCDDGSPVQNSVRKLEALVGRRAPAPRVA